ncbi:azurin [Coralloluteibacterium thermophilus]|uniref:Azurin n=1 Tax=Coralloluteibacterium thermophilum TaxID=2707049 RepID=A0ABV9NR04_9GAMM
MIRNAFPLLALGALGLAGALHGGTAHAADCATTVEATDTMQFSTATIAVPASCDAFEVTLKHVGKLPKNVMGHNIVVGRSADLAGINSDGMAAGLDNDYVKPGDARVVAHSAVIGGGETTTFSIPVSALAQGESYGFICSFPGHAGIMKGSVVLAD